MALPSTPLLDNFSRPDGNLTIAQGWTKPDPAFLGTLSIVSRLVKSDVSGIDMLYWNRDTFGDSEAWVTVNVSSGSHGVCTRVTGGAGATVGYAWWWRSTSGGQLVLSRITNTSLVTNILSTTAWASNTGVQLLLRTVGGTITGYAKQSGGDFVQLSQVFDSTHSSGFVAMFASDATVRLANFGGGTIDSLVAPAHPISGFRVM
jgi:hypothetical protein